MTARGLVLVLPLLLAAQPAGVVPQAAVPSEVWLSDSAQLTLTIEGPSPLRVEVPDRPENLLDGPSRLTWRIDRPSPPVVTPLEGGREKWTRAYRLTPFLPGKANVGFEPVKVRAGGDATAQDVHFPAVGVEVKTTGTPPSLDGVEVRGIEELATAPPPPPEPVGWQLAALLSGVFAIGLAVGLVRRWRAKPPAPPPGARAWAELDRAAAEPPGAAVVRVAAALRDYVARRYGLPAPQMTTAELAAAVWPDGFPPGAVNALSDLLAACDRAKFAPDQPATAAAEVVTRARVWVTEAEVRARS